MLNVLSKTISPGRSGPDRSQWELNTRQHLVKGSVLLPLFFLSSEPRVSTTSPATSLLHAPPGQPPTGILWPEAYLLPLHWGQRGRDASRPAGVHAVLGQSKGLLHAEAGEGRVQVVAVQAHGGGHGTLDGATAPFPGVFSAVSIGSLVPERQETALRWEYLASPEWRMGCQPCARRYKLIISLNSAPCWG